MPNLKVNSGIRPNTPSRKSGIPLPLEGFSCLNLEELESAKSTPESHLRPRSNFCRVGWGLPMLQANVCVLRLPPGFPAVPQYLGHTSVVPQPLTEPDKRLSHIRLFTQTFGSNPICVRSVLTVYSRLESCLCFSLHRRLSAGTFTPRGLAVSSLNRFPSRYGVAV